MTRHSNSCFACAVHCDLSLCGPSACLVTHCSFISLFEIVGFGTMPTIGTINDEGTNVDLYIPRKCHASNTLIQASDHGSIQINIADIDPNGTYSGTTKTFCIAGYLRHEGESDHAINRLCISHGIIRGRTARPKKAKAPAKEKVAKPAKGAKGKSAKTGSKPAAPKKTRPATAKH